MPSTTSLRMSWLFLLSVACGGLALAPTPYLAARQDTPLLVFIGLSDAQWTSCTSASFNWVYSGPDEPLSLFISNLGVPQDTDSSAVPTFTNKRDVYSLYPRDDVTVSIASSISPSINSFDLTSVAVPPGRYHLVAVVATSPPYSTNSSSFTVQQGSDTSCLSSTSPTSSVSSTSSILSTSSSSPTQSDSSTITSNGASSAGSTLTPSSSSSSSSAVPPIGAVSNSPVNKGAIAGGVVAGALVLIAALLFYCFFVVRKRRATAHGRAPAGPHVHAPKGGFGIGAAGGGNISGRWGGLGSVDSHAPLSDPKAQKPYVNIKHRTGTDDINSYLSRSGSVALAGGYASSPSEEKLSGSPSEEMVLTTLPYSSPGSDGYSNNNKRSHSNSSAAPTEHQRRGSQSQAHRPSLDSSASHAQSPFATPPATSPIGLARTSSTGAQQNPPRKPARKPVPSYTDSPDSPAISPVLSTAFPMSSPATPFADPPSSIPSSGHYSTRAERESLKSVVSKKSRSSKSKLRDKDHSNVSSATASAEELGKHELAHKNSFGPGGVEGKPVHYLIPDMPIQQ